MKISVMVFELRFRLDLEPDELRPKLLARPASFRVFVKHALVTQSGVYVHAEMLTIFVRLVYKTHGLNKLCPMELVP